MTFKRLIVCCDGTWENALEKPNGYPCTNVTKLTRVLKRYCDDGTNQIVMYHAGVGTGSPLNKVEGGEFGVGLVENIGELYNFICLNYVEGDDIILAGFSRGAFTARCVADMIASLGLLTPDGLDRFACIFDDYKDMGSKTRRPGEFLFAALAPYGGQKGQGAIRWEEDRKAAYRTWLKQKGYTCDTFRDGVTEITVKAVAVWDTVGDLGIPPIPSLRISGSPVQWKFTNTAVSHKVANAFQALSLDEPRGSFRPTLWERMPWSKTNLRQVWFGGSHANVGGGWPDEQMSNIVLGWMCDQLASVGVEIDLSRLADIFMQGLRFSAAHPFPHVPQPILTLVRPKTYPWGNADVFHGTLDSDDAKSDLHPETYELPALWATARPWSLGQTRAPEGILQAALGFTLRSPGLVMRADPDSNELTHEPLLRTGERVHSSVRVRLACAGLGLDDRAVWSCRALTGAAEYGASRPLWRLERGAAAELEEGGAAEATALDDASEAGVVLYDVQPGDGQWRWVFGRDVRVGGGGDAQVPQKTVLPEEPLTGPCERLLLALTRGATDVWRYAEANPPFASTGYAD